VDFETDAPELHLAPGGAEAAAIPTPEIGRLPPTPTIVDGCGFIDGLCVMWPRDMTDVPHEITYMTRRAANPVAATAMQARRAALYSLPAVDSVSSIPNAMFGASQRTRQLYFGPRCTADYAKANYDVVLDALRRTVRDTWYVNHELAVMLVPHHLGEQRSRHVECAKIGTTTAFTSPQTPTWAGLVELRHEASGARFFELLYTRTRPAPGSVFPFTTADGVTLALKVHQTTEVDVFEAERMHHVLASTHPSFLSVIKNTDARYRGELRPAPARDVEPWRIHVQQWHDSTAYVHPRVAHLVRALVDVDTPTSRRNEVIAAMSGPVFDGIVVSYITVVDGAKVTQMWAPRDEATCSQILACLEERADGVALTARDPSVVAFLRRILRLAGNEENASAPIPMMNHLLRARARVELSRMQSSAVSAVVHEVAVAHAIRIAEVNSRAVLPRDQRVQTNEATPVDYTRSVATAADTASTDDDEDGAQAEDLGDQLARSAASSMASSFVAADEAFECSPPESDDDAWRSMLVSTTGDE